jgi:protein unc-45
VRALVGLCKAGSSGGIDAANKPLPEETVQKLADSCRKFLTNPAKDFDLRRWAAEGLAYLSLDANVKESLVEDRPALKSLIDLGKTGNQNIIYGVVSVFVNLTNAYDKPEVVPEMKELAQFAKQHVPTEHVKVKILLLP